MKNSIKLELVLNENDSDTICLQVNGTDAGYICFNNINENIVAHIEDVQIEREFRGRGYYRMLLTAIFNLAGYDVLFSDNRNSSSNPIYEKWTGSELEDDQPIEIRLDGEDFEFDIIEEE